ncbi:MAG: minichromosome maintenance protein MCM, partial [Acidobacteria bacterium]|nr:minichromosome maintenance protein MCM [Acidobacteriota bacterium]
MRQEDYLRIWEEFLETRMEEEVLALADSYPDKRSLYVPFKLLERFNQEIADDLLDHPKQVLSAGNEVLRSIDLPMDVTLGNAFLRVISLPPTSRLKARNLREYHPGKFVALEGMVRMASKAFTAVTRVYVTCQRCGNGFMTSPARVKAGTIQCNNPACDRGGPYVKDIERSEKTAKRVIQLQENPEGLKGGELPETIGIILTGDLVEGISPGNRVVVNGIVMLREIKSKAGDTLDYEHYIDAVSVEVIEREFEEIDITPEDERAIRELSKSPTLIEDIRGSIAPTIYGQDDVKEAIALQL